MKRGLVVLATLLSAAMAVSAVAGCGSGSATSADGKTFTVKDTDIRAVTGDEFIIELESNVTTGYEWGISGSLNSSVVKKVRSTYVADPNAEERVGAGGVERWTFEAVGKGTATIRMVYARSWEQEAEPANTADFTVDVD